MEQVMIERLKRAYHLMENTNTDAIVTTHTRKMQCCGGHVHRLCHLTAEQWLKIYDAYKASGWDFTPDAWTQRQRHAALQGVVPKWNAAGQPIE